MQNNSCFGPRLFFILLCCVGSVRADYIVRTQAMFASTIAEFYVTAEGVRVELEVGADGDLSIPTRGVVKQPSPRKPLFDLLHVMGVDQESLLKELGA